MLKHALKVEGLNDAVDIVGTGGDGANSVNISTGASILAAACGAKVAKQGNRSSSSACGSADVLEALGIVIDLNAEGIVSCVNKARIGFMMSPKYHPAMKIVSPVRKKLRPFSVYFCRFSNPVCAENFVSKRAVDRVRIPWCALPVDHLKFNVDGAVKLDGCSGGIGDILRDEKGCCLYSFSSQIGAADSLAKGAISLSFLRFGVGIGVLEDVVGPRIRFIVSYWFLYSFLLSCDSLGISLHLGYIGSLYNLVILWKSFLPLSYVRH
ncbi:anthranilate phosphoribosyltransferase 1-like [Hibiscus syriacus]|uniref:anthranilate phosphoribosyltransferase 1-like n=1 Tax=Hibiscus syriacus TaxID=106335 RepID=UPI0019206BB6|nr:anthranilate phosphoribosyltransferase 1-like [Hibiscus syriacus]